MTKQFPRTEKSLNIERLMEDAVMHNVVNMTVSQKIELEFKSILFIVSCF